MGSSQVECTVHSRCCVIGRTPVSFKLSFGQPEAAAELVRHYLPTEVVAHIDLTSLERRAGSFVDEELRGQQGDLLFRARLREGGEAQIYLLLEHKSYRDRLVAFQLLRYVSASGSATDGSAQGRTCGRSCPW